MYIKNCIPWFFTYIHKWLLLDLMNVGPHELKVAHNPFLPLRQLSVLHTSTRLGFLQKSPQAGSQALIPCLQHHHRLFQLFGYLLPEQLFPGCILIRCELLIEKDRMCLQPIHHILLLLETQGVTCLLPLRLVCLINCPIHVCVIRVDCLLWLLGLSLISAIRGCVYKVFNNTQQVLVVGCMHLNCNPNLCLINSGRVLCCRISPSASSTADCISAWHFDSLSHSQFSPLLPRR